MNFKGGSRYNSLLHKKSGTEMSPWILYPIMLLSSLFIFCSISFYVRSLHAEDNRWLQHITKDSHRAGLYSLLAYTYEGFSLKIQEKKVKTSNAGASSEKKIVCYYNVPSTTNDNQDLRPSEIHADLCTHINIAFATIRKKTIHTDEQLIKTIKDVVNLKRKNNNLKVLLSIGGSGEDKGFSEMVVDHASRKSFIRSIKNILRTYKLDGVDLDWEFPSFTSIMKKKNRERQHFSQLLHEIRSEYIREKRDYLLTIAAAAPQLIVDSAYDMDQINMYVDFVNIMTYDFHYYTRLTPFTGLNSPLYSRPEEKFYMSTLNINYTIQMYLAKGLDRNKIVVGVPTYGHTFTLVNDQNGEIGSPSHGYGKAGSAGFVNYPEICAIFEYNDNSNVTTVIKYDESAKVPYLQRGAEWISFDDRKSVMEKANYIKDNDLGGAMIYSLNADDFSGKCLLKGLHVKFPLSQSLKTALHDGSL